MSPVKPAFLMDAVTLPLDRIRPSRQLKPQVKTSSRYKMIEASVRELGVIEPLIVYPETGKTGFHTLLDGHVRLEVLRELGQATAMCLVSTDDEGCTYNHRVNRIAPIQENRMILRAIEAGVPEERIAKALNVTTKTIRESKNRLNGICKEAIETLKDKPIAEVALRSLKKVKPYRQIEMAGLMTMSNTFTASYAKTLLAATPSEQLLDPPKPDTRPEQISKLESEMRTVERDFVMLEESYSRDTLNLQVARAYLKTLLQNARVKRYLSQKHPELEAQLQKVVDVDSLDA
ncbi:MAG: ParB N-terminal domain-containing protein [Labilithrix sp.]|nr:ParB N-terminal domain-containing protein [Labilithrix sp.]